MAPWLAAVGAQVAWRSEGRHAERPDSLRWGGEVLPVVVLERWVEGPLEAGGAVKRVFVVGDPTGRTLRITRGEGEVTVEVRHER
ncbi:MAG: hypothetical protein ACOY3Y_05095 [Acidobacteriota bacterium]